MTNKRILNELEELKVEQPTFCSAGPKEDNLRHWIATITGPEDTPYEGGIFKLVFIH